MEAAAAPLRELTVVPRGFPIGTSPLFSPEFLRDITTTTTPHHPPPDPLGRISFNCSVMRMLPFSQEQSFPELNHKSPRQAGADKNVGFDVKS